MPYLPFPTCLSQNASMWLNLEGVPVLKYIWVDKEAGLLEKPRPIFESNQGCPRSQIHITIYRGWSTRKKLVPFLSRIKGVPVLKYILLCIEAGRLEITRPIFESTSRVTPFWNTFGGRGHPWFWLKIRTSFLKLATFDT